MTFSGPVPPRGPETAKIMVVGDVPDANQERLGQPFVGPSGNLLTEMLNQSGINPDEVYYTNLCPIRPPGNKVSAFFSKDGIPNSTMLEGLALLKDQISRVRPNIILPLGGYPLKFLTGKGKWKKVAGKVEAGFTGLSDYRGYIIPGTAFAAGTKCLPTYHPATILGQYSRKHIVRADLTRAREQSGFPELQYPRKYILIEPTGADRESWRAWLTSTPGTQSPPFRFSESAEPRTASATPSEFVTVPSGDFCTADIEYIGSRLLCCGLTRHRDVAIVFRTPTHAEVSYVRDILLSGIPLCFQNGMFDCSILEWFYDIAAVKHMKHDTMIAMHSAYTEMPKDLGFIGSLFEAQYPWWDGIDSAYWKGVKAGTRSVDECLVYNGSDVWNTHQAMEMMLADELLNPNVAQTYRHEMDTISPLWEMSKLGVKIDTERLDTLQKTLTTEIATLEAGLAMLNGGTLINVKSNLQVAKFLFDRLAIPNIVEKTPTGAAKLNDDSMALLLDKGCKNDTQRNAVKMVRAVRERRDLISKFCEIELDSDGRMRCHYDPAKTVTGRLSSRKFYPTGLGTNLQNVPRDSRVRAVFIPDKGCIFGYADLKSAESLVVAHITGDPEMLRLHSPEYMDGTRDGHKFVASFLFGKPIEEITKAERHIGKTTRHAGNYGMGPKKFMDIINSSAEDTGVSVTMAQAKVFIDKYRQLHHMLPVWWSDVLQQLWSTHTITSCHGRERIFYDRPDACLQEAIAYNPQSTVAQTLNLGLLRVAASEELHSLGFRMLLQVHDAIGFQVPETNADAAISLASRLMLVDVPIARKGLEPYSIQIPVDVQVGYNWGESDGFLKDGSPNPNALNPNGLRTWKAI